MTSLPSAEGFALKAATGDLLQFAEPQPKSVKLDGRVIEPKYDGWRILAHRASDGVHLYARKGSSYTGRLPMIERALMVLPAGTWLDGEVVADEGWGTVQSVMTTLGGHAAEKHIRFVVFDVLAIGGLDARPLPLSKRRVLAERALESVPGDRVVIIDQQPATWAAHEAHLNAGLEGSVVKSDTPYRSGKKGAGWTKLKPQDTTDVVVMGFEPGKGGFTGMVGAIVFGLYDADGTLVRQGTCSGFNLSTRKAMTEHPERYVGTVIELAFHAPTKAGGDRRHPQWKRPRPDKAATDCVLPNVCVTA